MEKIIECKLQQPTNHISTLILTEKIVRDLGILYYYYYYY